MLNLNYVGKIFNDAFEAATKVPFDPAWSNGTGYYDNAVSYPLEYGSVHAAIDNCERKIILVGTRLGTVVVFQRYTGRDDIYVSNHRTSKIFNALLGTTNLNETQMYNAVGVMHDKYWLEKNIGQLLEIMAEELAV